MLIAAVFYVRYLTPPIPRTLSKYFNPCFATARLKPTCVSKVNTVVQLINLGGNFFGSSGFQSCRRRLSSDTVVFHSFHQSCISYSYYHGWKTVQVIKADEGRPSSLARKQYTSSAAGPVEIHRSFLFWCSA